MKTLNRDLDEETRVIFERLFYHTARKVLEPVIFEDLCQTAAALLNTVDEDGIPYLMWSLDNNVEDLVNELEL